MSALHGKILSMSDFIFALVPAYLYVMIADAAGAVHRADFRQMLLNAILSSIAAAIGVLFKSVFKKAAEMSVKWGARRLSVIARRRRENKAIKTLTETSKRRR